MKGILQDSRPPQFASQRTGRARSPWWDIWFEHRLFLIIIAMHILAGVAATWAGYAEVIRAGTWSLNLFVHFLRGTLVGGLCVLMYHRLRVHRDSDRRLGVLEGWDVVLHRFSAAHLTVVRLGGVLVVALGTAASTAIHDGWKGTITGYTWDTRLLALDRVLHGGTDPWRLLHPLIGTPTVTYVLDTLYWLWYAFLLACVVWVAWSTDRQLRERMLVAYALTWVMLGTVAAHAFASVGPCFLTSHLGQATTFDSLVRYLEAVNDNTPLVALGLQQALWEAHATGNRNYWMSISAMPSLHIAVPALFAIAGWRTHRALGLTIWIYTGVMLVASVHLGWHYAVDGYVGILGAISAWAVAGRITRHRMA